MRGQITEPADFEAMWACALPTVARYVAARVGPAAAPDVVAEVCKQAFESRRRFRSYEVGGPLPWILGIASNAVRQHYRAERRWLERIQRAALVADTTEADVESTVMSRSTRAALVASLGSLGSKEREAFLLYVLADLSYSEIGISLGVPEGTAKSRVSRARNRLAVAMREVVHESA